SEHDAVEAVRDLTDGRGVDYAFEAVGKSQTIRQAFEMTRRGGTTVVVGAGSLTDEVKFNAMELFMDSKSILGCIYGSTDPDRDFPVLAEQLARGRIDAASMVTRKIGLTDIENAFSAMEAGEVTRSLVVFDDEAGVGGS
ncbi:MAG TPA: zinc-binding dehydrogenase, partial [Acidimicrobiales bacterium]|nr:zinc-binding dehydrogenase [Acidimicrobiales bacterium]